MLLTLHGIWTASRRTAQLVHIRKDAHNGQSALARVPGIACKFVTQVLETLTVGKKLTGKKSLSV